MTGAGGGVQWLHVAALATYLPATLLALPILPRLGAGVRRAAAWLSAAGLLLQLAAIVLRWDATGHGPFVGGFEVLSSDAWLLLAAVRIGSVVAEEVRRAAPVAQPMALALLLAALALGPRAMKLPIVMDSAWLVAHSLSFKLAFAVTALAFSLAVRRRRSPAGGAEERRLDFVGYRWLGLGFAFWNGGMLLGAIWGYHSFGSFWSWDPVEMWALVAWGCYGAALHFDRFFAPSPAARRGLVASVFAVALVALYVAPMLKRSLHAGYMN